MIKQTWYKKGEWLKNISLEKDDKEHNEKEILCVCFLVENISGACAKEERVKKLILFIE